MAESSIPTDDGKEVAQVPPVTTVQSGYLPELLKQRHAETANKLVFWLLGILGGSILLHYTCLMVLIGYRRDDAVKHLEDTFHAWLPVLSGLAGAAVTYYFTKDDR